MKKERVLKNGVSISNEMYEMLYSARAAQYDAAAKKLLSKKEILGHILKIKVKEFATSSVKDIAENYIEGEPVVSQIPIDKDETNAEKEELLEINTERKGGYGKDENRYSSCKNLGMNRYRLATAIQGSKNEGTSQTEGTILFDILFRVIVLESKEQIMKLSRLVDTFFTRIYIKQLLAVIRYTF